VASGEHILQKRTYETIQRALRGSPEGAVREYISDLAGAAPWFQRLKFPREEPTPSVQVAAADLLSAGGLTAVPLALYAYGRYVRENLAADEIVGG
jgi:hypothetical protein